MTKEELGFEAEAHELFAANLREAAKYGSPVNYQWAPSSPAWVAMMTKAKELGWPERYREDLVLVDRETAHEMRESSFWWGIRPSGTHLYDTGPDARMVDRTFSEVLWFYWDGEALVPE